MTDLSNRHDFVFTFSVTNGNPNGDPDAGNAPRTDSDTGKGVVTDVCIKRKIRNCVQMLKDNQPPYEIYVRDGVFLNEQHRRSYEALSVKPKTKKETASKEATEWMCKNFWDIRTFGAVMSTGVNAGQVRGPVQFGFPVSIDPISPSEMGITRCARMEDDNRGSTEMGRKNVVPFGLYRGHGFVNARLAQQTGFGEEDLELLFDAMKDMFEHDRSAARGEMALHDLIVFRHESDLGNEHAHRLFDRISIERISEGVARVYGDYKVSVDDSNMPAGVTVKRLVG